MLSTLKRYFGYNSFRPLQENIIRHILSNKDCLAVERVSAIRYQH